MPPASAHALVLCSGFCFFRSRQKFGERYMTLGFNDTAKLDEGGLWPISLALKELGAAEEAKIVALIKKAVD
jgi:hypothetical protein